MADGAKVRTNIEELREHFDIHSVLGYFVSGKLQEWLADRYYDEEAEKIGELNKDDKELNNKLCSILGVEYMETDKADMETLHRINEKKAILRQVTSDTNIIDNAEWVAFDQEELADLLDEDATTIYLYGDKFNIPVRRKNMTYIGVNNPQISINAKEYKDIESNDIKFVNVTLPEVLRPTQDTENKDKTEYKSLDFFERIRRKYGENESKAEKLYLENKFDEAIPIFEEEAKKGNYRAYYFLVDNIVNSFGNVYRDKDIEEKCRKECLKSDDPVVKMQGIYVYTKETGEFENEFLKIKEYLFKQAMEGDPFAAFEVMCLKYNNYYDIPDDVMERCKEVALFHNHCAIINYLGILACNEEDYETSNHYYMMASKLGWPWGQFNVAKGLENGWGVDKNLDKAFKLYKAAAEKGLVNAIKKIADCYYNGYMVTQDYDEAAKWYKKGAEKNHAESQNMLGICYAWGRGVEQDRVKCFLWCLKAAEQGLAAAQYNVGDDFYTGYAVYNDEANVTNYDEAYKWFVKAANQGYLKAMYSLGECYRQGRGVSIDIDKAKEWYQKASEGGNEDAKNALENFDDLISQDSVNRMSDEHRQEMASVLREGADEISRTLEEFENDSFFKSPAERFFDKLFK